MRMTSCQETEEEPRFCNVAERRPPRYRAKMAAPIDLHLEFGGGAELLFGGVKDHHVKLPSQSEPWNVKQLLAWIKTNLLRERPELFIQGDTVANWTTCLKTRTTWFSSPRCMEARIARQCALRTELTSYFKASLALCVKLKQMLFNATPCSSE
ncbi:uncharacterized protein LOC117396734 isoform X2 [Acipenser ruthenus]|uniref:uncharacterized protein LOC117396734 isoform X2 n=1 Tax=Acipenser ruthenus TaxID=7906 RepID=UPI00274077D5|nr:uncharacterized protein LOC117396734 isoform X2 [Acipenser ruthenus]